jgi:hypothetical protein
VLTSAGVDRDRADELQREVEQGAILLAVHVDPEITGNGSAIRSALSNDGGRDVEVVNWPDA